MVSNKVGSFVMLCNNLWRLLRIWYLINPTSTIIHLCIYPFMLYLWSTHDPLIFYAQGKNCEIRKLHFWRIVFLLHENWIPQIISWIYEYSKFLKKCTDFFTFLLNYFQIFFSWIISGLSHFSPHHVPIFCQFNINIL